MSYTRTEWENNTTPAINASNLNHIEDGIYNASYAIDNLPKSMVLRGTLGTGTGEIADLPTNAEVGDVYFVNKKATYASVLANIGDLFIKRPNDWLRIPSGDESIGVTQIIAGSGLSGGTITSSGTLSLDPTYLAQYGANARNGLFSSAEKQKLATLANVAVSGSYSDLINKPTSIQLYETTGTNIDGAMTQNASTAALNNKAALVHTHNTSDITQLNDYLAKNSSNVIVQAAAHNHVHGKITNDGKLQGQDQSGQILITGDAGEISCTSAIDISKVNGISSEFTSDRNRISALESKMPGGSAADVASKDHTHNVFTASTDGFVPASGDNSDSKVLFSDGTWGSVSSAVTIAETNNFVAYQTSFPTGNNTEGLKVYVGTEPSTKYSGWIYFITD